MESEFLQVAREILRSTKAPLKSKQIMQLAVERKLFSDKLAGKTPGQTLKSKLSQEIRKNGQQSVFVRTAPGRFFLRELLSPDSPQYSPPIRKKSLRSEKVLVFDRIWLEELGLFQGIKTTRIEQTKRKLLKSEQCYFMNRLDAEVNNQKKQVLTYVLIKRSDGALLAFRRGNYNNTEEFLKGRRCIGFGGHVSDKDQDLFTDQDLGLTACVVREVTEELCLQPKDVENLKNGKGLELLGVLNDESSDAGKRHIAFVFLFTLEEDQKYAQAVVKGEQSVTQLQWLDPCEISAPIWDFEYWSQLCLLKFFPKLVNTSATYSIIKKKRLEPPNIIAILGSVGSGKSYAAQFFAQHYGYTVINSGQEMAKLLGIQPVPLTPRRLFQERANRFIKSSDGPRKLARAIALAIGNAETERIIVDGIRQPSTLELVKKSINPIGLGLICVKTTPDIAFQLFREREGQDRTLEDFFLLLNAPVEQDLWQMESDCDAVLYNWTGKRKYKSALISFMVELGINKESHI